MPHPPSVVRAANNLITRSLGLRTDQDLLVFADADSLPVAEVIAQVARELGVHTSILFVPHVVQSSFKPNENLPIPVEAAVREADAVLSCLSDRAEHMAYRRRVLRTSWNRRTKLAHAPGMTLDILRMADTDYEQVRWRCHQLAIALVLGRQAEIITRDHRGGEHRLLVDIAGWDFTPGIGDGIIPDGAWANLPPGETFIVPLSGQGEIVINGSIPGRVLEPGEELILSFVQGRLVGLQPKESPAARHLHDTQIAYAQQRGDSNWSNLAEVGFGTNPAVRRLTGIELVDEKKDGTIHIALGDSTSLGGKVESAIHCDLVTERATVFVDGKLLLQNGDWRDDGVQWWPDYQAVTPPRGWWQSIGEIRRSGVRTEIVNEQLMRQMNSGPGRWDHTPVGSELTARLAADMHRILPENGEGINREQLLSRASQLGLDEATVPALLWVMRQYDLVRLPGEEAT